MTNTAPTMGFSFDDLASRSGLIRLDRAFLDCLSAEDAALHARLLTARATPDDVARKDESDLIVALGPHLDRFVAALFGISEETDALLARTAGLDPIHACKRLFVQRQAVRKYADPSGFDAAALRAGLEAHLGEALTEPAFARHVMAWEKDQPAHAEALDLALRYAAWATLTEAGRAAHQGGTLFRVPHKVDPAHLVPIETIERDGVTMLRLPEHEWRHREGFALTDHGMNDQQALDQINYCIWCHEQGKDSCSQGLKDRKTGQFQKSPFGVTLAGCPLDEKISEMHMLRAQGSVIGAFATIAVDNPMMAATGHRICNDCMKACIYQKQEPVDIPQAETRVLKNVLDLPWGFEIYALVTRWNPLDIRRPLPRPDSGKKVLIVGLGPAGFTLAHHLMNDGHTVVAIDGLKIEPLTTTPPLPLREGAGGRGTPAPVPGGSTPPPALGPLRGPSPQGEGEKPTIFNPTTPVRDTESLFENLDDRVMAGFGGVAEYGITVRWNKNYLKLVRLLLERRPEFAHFGGVRFGGGATMGIDDAWALGFDHIALCMGAGKPTVLDIPNGLARGVRQASDFLMALQLTGAAKQSSIANLQLRLPVVVIGGGLTAIDTATESLAYYVRQVEKFAGRYRILVAERGEAAVRARWSAEETEIADEFLAHAAAIAAERADAARENRTPALARLLDGWGGATLAYRRRLVDAPSYTLNHEEVAKALEEGVRFAEGLTPKFVQVDSHGHAAALTVTRADGTEATLPARAIIVAAGTQPNTVLAREDGRIELDGRYFQAVDETGAKVTPTRALAKPDQAHVLMHRAENGRFLSFFGDLHPSFFGNVVKAMGGAKRGYPVVSRALAALPGSEATGPDVIARMRDSLTATVHAVNRLTPTIVEVVVRAPAAARAFKPGQFYRLQNYEVLAPRVGGGSATAVAERAGVAASSSPLSVMAGLDPATHAPSVAQQGGTGGGQVAGSSPAMTVGAGAMTDGTGTNTPPTILAMEGLAMTGAWTDPDQGLVSVIALEMGGSSDLCAVLQPGERVVLMGPTGAATEIHANTTVALVGGGLGNAVLFSIGAAHRAAGSKVIYFAGYKALRDRYKVPEIERAADVIIWCCDEAPGFPLNPERPQDRSFVGNIVQAMAAYASGALGEQSVPLNQAEHLIAIGSDRMMQAVGAARHGVLRPFLRPDHSAIGSINSPMQCMMKEVCAQCLQAHVDPVTGERSVVFSCFNQDQALDHVDFPALNERLRQNGVQEKLTAQWIDRSLRQLALR